MTFRPLILAVASLALAGSLAACGDDEPDVSLLPQATSPVTATTPGSSPGATAPGDDGGDPSDRSALPTTDSGSDKSLARVIGDRSELATLGTALGAADLRSRLAGKGPYTVFAPNNDAFTKLGTRLDMLLQTSATGQLVDVLEFHVVEGRYRSSDLKDGQLLRTLNGTRLRVQVDGSQITVRNSNGRAAFVEQDVAAANGVVHVVDAVLQPKQ